MAVAVTNITSGGNQGTSSEATASFTPVANRLYIVTVGAHYASANDATPTAVHAGGLTLVQIDTEETASNNQRLTVFRAMKPSGLSAGAITFTWSATQQAVAWSVDEVTGMDTSGTNGAGAIVQEVVGTGSSAAPSITLAAFSGLTNATIGCFANNNNGNSNPGTVTAGSGFALLINQRQIGGVTGTNIGVGTEWRADNDTTVNCAVSTTDAYAGLALEIAAAGAGGGSTSTVGMIPVGF